MGGFLLKPNAGEVRMRIANTSEPYVLTEKKLGDPEENWAIVKEVGGDRWLGRVADQKSERVIDLDPALMMPANACDVHVYPNPGDPRIGVTSEATMHCMYGRPGVFHPVRSVQYSHIEWCHEMLPDFRKFLMLLVGMAAGQIKPGEVEEAMRGNERKIVSGILPT